MDADTGDILYSKNPDEQIPPASLTKLMTIHICLKEAASRGMSLDSPMKIPPESYATAQPQGSSLMWLGPGQKVTLRDLLLGMAVPSGNDAAVAAALNFAPTIADFAEKMNAEAAAMGLKHTVFVGPSGISAKNSTTADDVARFCRQYLTLHPATLKLFHSVREFRFPRPENLLVKPRAKHRVPVELVFHNHIPRLGVHDLPDGRRYTVDGLKTGFIYESGYNAALTAAMNGKRLIVVTLGTPASLGPEAGEKTRADDALTLFNWAWTK
jgi:D-alanyl-D-alanine carboxypeptidase (penicillin-binding protein 5/6)